MDVTRTAMMTFSKAEVIAALHAAYPELLPLTHAFAGSIRAFNMEGGPDRVTIVTTVPVGH